MEETYILGGVRSPIGLKNGIYRHIPAEDIGAHVIRSCLDRCPGIRPDLVIGGNAAGCGGNITRLAALKAGCPPDIPAITVDAQCGSGLQSVSLAMAMIQSGQAEVVLAGGMESSSTQPLRKHHPNHPLGETDGFYSVAMFSPDSMSETVMLEGAERVAASDGMTAEELNRWVLTSHEKAFRAKQENQLADIIVPFMEHVHDEGIRHRLNPRLLQKLPPALSGGQYIHAGNACRLNDGAAFVLLCSGRFLRRFGLRAAAKLICSGTVGSSPDESPRSAVAALKKVALQSGIPVESLSAIEINEAFAVIDVLFEREFSSFSGTYNHFGGALAYGHPYGASGAIILLHLLKSLAVTEGEYGACAVAGAGGIGTGLLVRKESG